MTQDIGEKVNSGLRQLEECDFAGFREACTDKATVWHNDGKGDRTIDESLEQFKSFAATLDSLRYDVVRQFQNPDGVLRQHVLHLVMPDGTSSEVHAVAYFRFDSGLIDRIEEYMYEVPPGN